MPEREIVITEKGLEKLKKELLDLRTVRRPEVISRIKAAKELGDLSENAEYATAKEEQSFIEGRIQELEQIIKKARVVTNNQSRSQKTVVAGSLVTVEVDGETLSLEIVGQTESDPANSKVSVDSPVGQALLGHRERDLIKVQTPDGPVTYKILTIA